MAAGCQMSKCRARCRLIAGKLRDPGTKAKGRYRFTPRVAIQDAEDRSIPFSIWTSREKARKRGVKRCGGHCFVLLALLLLDDRAKRSGHTYNVEARNYQLVADDFPRFPCNSFITVL